MVVKVYYYGFKIMWEQGWRSGDSARLPPMWPRFYILNWHHMWFESGGGGGGGGLQFSYLPFVQFSVTLCYLYFRACL